MITKLRNILVFIILPSYIVGIITFLYLAITFGIKLY